MPAKRRSQGIDDLMKRFLLVFFLCFAPALAQADLLVSDELALKRAVDGAPAGETIVLEDGVYLVSDLKLRRSITLKGKGEAVLTAPDPVAKGLLNPVGDASVRVENLTFRGARSPDKNGAGIRHDGADLTIVNCRFENNENGVLATGKPEGKIRIHKSRFTNNGHGDGYSHGIYVVRSALVEIENSQFIGTRIGHHVKSLAAKTSITGSTLDDGDGRTSYAVDASKGGDLVFENNNVIQSANSDNRAIINYSVARGGSAGTVTARFNKITNRKRRAVFLQNATDITPVVHDNEIINENGATLFHQETAASTGLRSSEEGRKANSAPTTRQATFVSAIKEQAPPGLQQRSGVIPAPDFTRNDLGALAYFKLRNNWSTAAPAGLVTFGQAFAPARVTPDQAMMAQIGGQIFSLQADVKSLHADGSVRHAVVTVKTPMIASGKQHDAVILPSRQTGPPSIFEPLDIISTLYFFPIRITFLDSGKSISVNLREDAIAAFSSKGLAPWLNGELAVERRIEKEIAPHLQLRADIRVYHDSRVRTSLVFANEKSFAAGSRDLRYTVEIGEGGGYSSGPVDHHRSSNWREIFWTGAQPRLHVVHDLMGLIASGSVLPLDASQGVAAAAIAENQGPGSDLPPLAAGLIEKKFPTTGGRADLGITPTWTAHYLVTQLESAKILMLEQAEAGGAVPWHFIDDRHGGPISLLRRPTFWADNRGLEAQYAPHNPHPDIFSSADGGWRIDHAHKPSLSAVPWLVTGDRYFADELAMQASYALFGHWPTFHQGGLIAIDVGQVRGSAWSLRDLSDAAFLLPDDHGSKSYLQQALDENLSVMREKYVSDRRMASAGELEGFIEEHIGREPERISPWQNDYVALALWLASHRGNDDARALLGWSSNFHAGRFISPDFDQRFAAAYVFPAKTPDGKTYLSRWLDLAAKLPTPDDLGSDPLIGYKGLADGYIGSAIAALTAITSETASPDAYFALASALRTSEDFDMWRTRSRGNVHRKNGFFFSLKSPGGAIVSRQDIRWNGKGDDNSNLLIGETGGGVISGGPGDDILLGLVGDDVLNGGEGDDYLHGGAGRDRMTGGVGRDVFAISTDVVSVIEITDFNPDEDKLMFDGRVVRATNFSAVSTPAGAMINFSNGASVFLPGVEAEAASTAIKEQTGG